MTDQDESNENQGNSDDLKPDAETHKDAIQKARENLKNMIETLTIQRLCFEQTTELQKLQAKLKFNWFEGLIEAGFDENQAMSIILSNG